MGSLTAGGLPITQANNVLSHTHNGNYVRQSNAKTDTGTVISNSGTISTSNFAFPFGLEFAPPGGQFVTGLVLNRRELMHNASASTIQSLELNKFANDSGNLKHVVSRAMGIHTSIQDRESAKSALGAMSARTERKVFFLDSDTGKLVDLLIGQFLIAQDVQLAHRPVSPTPMCRQRQLLRDLLGR